MKMQDLKSGDKLLLQTDDGGMRLCTFEKMDMLNEFTIITIDGVEGGDKFILNILGDTDITKRDGDDHKLYTLQAERIKEYYVLANSVEDEFMKVFTEATGAKFVDVTPIDQYKCPSYFDDLGELKDCSCGKCK